MNLATRILGVAIFVSLLAGATYAAFQGFDTDPQFSAVEIEEPGQVPSIVAGQQAPLALGLNNTGQHDTNVTLAADGDGFTFETNPGVTTVPARERTQANGLLSADSDIEGEHNVTIVASENESGERLDSITFSVSVVAPTPPELTLEPVLPAVLPGEEARFQAVLQNTVDAPQRVNLTLTDTDGMVDPEQVTLQQDGTGSATVTADVPADASGTYTIELVATNEAGQSVSAERSVPVVAEGEIAAEPLQTDFDVREGNRYTVPVTIVSNADASGEVTASGPAVVATNFTTIEPRSATGGFVTLAMDEGAPDPTTHEVTLEIGDRTQTFETDVSLVAEGETPGQGQQAELEYTSRLMNGSVVETSVPGVAEGPFPKSEYFQSGRQSETLTVRMGGLQQQTPPGVVQSVENMTEGESLTVTLAPEDAYGPERRTQEMDATTELQRDQEVPKLIEDVPKNRLPGEFDIENREEGEIIEFETQAGDVPITLRFRVLELTEDTVTLERVAEEGETITFYAPWPNATEVTRVNETVIVYTTTPPDAASEEPFTWDANPNGHEAEWGNTTLVDTVNETAIVLRHQPEEGLEYTAAAGQFGQEREFRVENVTTDTITLSTPNQDPRGGETVTFDLTLVDISEAQQRRLPPGLGG